MKEQKSLNKRECLRCAYTWWPRQLKAPRRCARCKTPYWNRPRRTGAQTAARMGKKPSSLVALNIGDSSAITPIEPLVSTPPPKPEPDRSFAKALTVLHQMKSTGATWAQMAERLRQEFDVQLDKDQVKGLVRQ